MVAATGDIITHLTESSFSPIAAPLERQKPSSSVEYEINLSLESKYMHKEKKKKKIHED